MSDEPRPNLLQRHPWICGLVIVIAAWLVYANSLNGAFVFDDDHNIVENKALETLWPITNHVLKSRRGVVNFTFAINYQLGGFDTFGFHVGNVIIHCLAGLALFGLVRQTLRIAPTAPWVGDRLRQRAEVLALCVALLWVVHPLTTMAVSYIVQRLESLMALFYVLTLFCLARSYESPRWPLWWAGAVAACAFGMNCKEVMFTAPIVAIVYDRTFLSATWKTLVKQRGILHLLLLATWAVLLADNPVTTVTSEDASVGFASPVFTPLTYLLAQSEVLVVYLWLCIWPAKLSIDWGWPPYQGLTLSVVAAMAFIGTLLLGSFYAFYRRSWLGFVGLAFFFVLSITSSIIPIADLLMEHRMYLPLASVVSLLVIGGYLLLLKLEDTKPTQAAKFKPVAVALVMVAALALGSRTIARNFDYASRVAIWEAAVEARPHHGRAWHNLGEALQRVGRIDEGLAAYEESIRLLPNFTDAYNNMALLYMDQRRYADAHRMLEHALEIKPRDHTLRYNYGKLLMAQNNLVEASQWFQATVDVAPEYSPGWNNLGVTLARLGQSEQALAAFNQALSLEPDSVEYRVNIGTFLQRSGQRDQAVIHYREAAKLDPMNPLPLEHIGNVMAIEADYAQAADMYERAWRIAPKGSIAMRQARVWVLADQPANAVTVLRRWLDLEPSSPMPRQSLAWLLATHPDPTVRNPKAALALAEQAMTVAGQPHPAMLITFAAAQAANGQFEAAVRTARQAQSMLSAAGHESAAEQIAGQIAEYEAGRPLQTKAAPLAAMGEGS